METRSGELRGDHLASKAFNGSVPRRGCRRSVHGRLNGPLIFFFFYCLNI